MPSFILIGRAKGNLKVDDETVSGAHCIIYEETYGENPQDSKYILVDLQSKNGTYLNSEKATPLLQTLLKSGHKINLGPLEFAVFLGE